MMKNKIRMIINCFTDKNKFSLEQRIFNLIIVFVAFSFFSTAITNYLIRLDRVTVFITLAGTLLSIYTGYISVIRNRYDLAAGMFFVMMAFILLPLMFFFNGGIYGSIPYFMVIFSAVITVIFNGRKKAAVIAVYMALVTFLVLMGYIYPGNIIGYKTDFSKTFDITLAIFISSILNIILLTIGTKYYKLEQNRAEKLNRLLLEEKEKLSRLSIIDGLTNIYNHRFIVGYLEDEISKCTAGNKVLTAIFLDIDNFKSINDTYGHLFGDLVLKKISETITANLRDTDLAGRYGGEEFLIVLPSKNLEQGYRIAERVRHAISNINWEKNVAITVSGGVAQLKGDNLKELLEQTDGLLYKAKGNGKNRIEKAG